MVPHRKLVSCYLFINVFFVFLNWCLCFFLAGAIQSESCHMYPLRKEGMNACELRCVCVRESARAMLTIAVGSIFRAFFFFCSWPRLNRVMHPLASPPPPPQGFPAQRVNSGSLKLRHTSSHSAACTGTDRNVRGWVSTCTHSLPVFPPIHSELLGLRTVARYNLMKSAHLVWSYCTVHLQCRCIERNDTQSTLQSIVVLDCSGDPILSHWILQNDGLISPAIAM